MSGLDWSAVSARLREARDAKVVGTLSTILEDDVAAGAPFGSIVPFGLDADDRVVVVVSDLAVHTHNLRRDARASFTVAEPGGDPQRGWRLTVVGRFVEDDRYRGAYAATWPIPALADFHAFVLQPTTARLIMGFGVMGWVPAPTT
jgi:putative heme iron utilization protein